MCKGKQSKAGSALKLCDRAYQDTNSNTEQ